MEEKKRYLIPSKLADLDNKVMAYRALRDVYAKLPFGFKKAVKCSLKAESLNAEFWSKVHKLHPGLRGKSLQHNSGADFVTECAGE